jgi:hypothetical protein
MYDIDIYFEILDIEYNPFDLKIESLEDEIVRWMVGE